MTEVENRICNAFEFHDPLKKLRPKVPDNLLDGVDDKKASNNYQAEGNGSQWDSRSKRKLESDITDGGGNPQKRPCIDRDWLNVSDNQQTFGSAGQVGSNLVGKSKRQDTFSDLTVVFNNLERFIQYFLDQGGNFDDNGQMIFPDEKNAKENAANDSEGCSPPPDTDSVSSLLNESTDSSNYGSEGDSSDSLDYFSILERLEENPPLAEIPLTEDEKELIEDFCGKIKGVREENYREYQKNLRDWCTDSLKRVECLADDLPQGIRLNSLCDDHKNTVSGLVIETVLDILGRVPVITSAVAMNFELDGPCKSALDDPDNVKAVVNIVRKLIVNGGRIELEPCFYDEHERLCRMIGEDMMSEFIEKREQIYDELKSAAYEGIVNKDTQTQEDDLVVDIDNCYFYIKYPQDVTIEVAKVVNSPKVKGLSLKYHIFHIGESIVRFEENKDEKRNYTDILQGSIEMSFATKAGKISIHLYPSSTETKDGKTENRGIKVEIDEESKTRFSQLEDEEKKSLGKNCLLGGQSVLEVIIKSLEKNGDVPARFLKAL